MKVSWTANLPLSVDQICHFPEQNHELLRYISVNPMGVIRKQNRGIWYPAAMEKG